MADAWRHESLTLETLRDVYANLNHAAPPAREGARRRAERAVAGAVFELGLRQCSPKVIKGLLARGAAAGSPAAELTTEHIKSHLQNTTGRGSPSATTSSAASARRPRARRPRPRRRRRRGAARPSTRPSGAPRASWRTWPRRGRASAATSPRRSPSTAASRTSSRRWPPARANLMHVQLVLYLAWRSGVDARGIASSTGPDSLPLARVEKGRRREGRRCDGGERHKATAPRGEPWKPRPARAGRYPLKLWLIADPARQN